MDGKNRTLTARGAVDRGQRKEQAEKSCSYCRKVPRQIICLSCDHETCLDCFWKTAETRAEVPKSFKCSLCKRLTFLGREVRDLIGSFATAPSPAPPTVNYSFPEYDLTDSGLSSPASPSSAAECELRCPQHNEVFVLYDEERRALLCASCPRSTSKAGVVPWKQTRETLLGRFGEDLHELELRRRLLRGQVSEHALARKSYEDALSKEFKRLDGALRAVSSVVDRAREEFDRAKRRHAPASPPPELLRTLEGQTHLLRQAKEARSGGEGALTRFWLESRSRVEELLECPLGPPLLTERAGPAVAAATRKIMEKAAQGLRDAAEKLESPKAPPTECKGKFGFSLENAGRQSSALTRERNTTRQSASPMCSRSKNLVVSQILRKNTSSVFKSLRKF